MNINKYIFSLFLVVLFLAACKKDRLKEEKGIFIGKWEWVYTRANLDLCYGFPIYDYMFTPSNTKITYQIEFVKNGKVYFYKDHILIDKHRLVFNAYGPPYTCEGNGYTFYAIDLDNENGTDIINGLEGCISKDTLKVGRGFPYYDDECNFYTSYFVKQ